MNFGRELSMKTMFAVKIVTLNYGTVSVKSDKWMNQVNNMPKKC